MKRSASEDLVGVHLSHFSFATAKEKGYRTRWKVRRIGKVSKPHGIWYHTRIIESSVVVVSCCVVSSRLAAQTDPNTTRDMSAVGSFQCVFRLLSLSNGTNTHQYRFLYSKGVSFSAHCWGCPSGSIVPSLQNFHATTEKWSFLHGNKDFRDRFTSHKSH